MEIRPITPNEWKYTYSQSMQPEGQPMSRYSKSRRRQNRQSTRI